MYAAHAISAAIIALAESADITEITDLAVTVLSKMYDNNLVWCGFLLRYRSNLYVHNMVPHYVTKYTSASRGAHKKARAQNRITSKRFKNLLTKGTIWCLKMSKNFYRI